jgi:site-specific recombinase XerD
MPRKKVILEVNHQTETIFKVYENSLKMEVSENTFNNYIKTVKHFLNYLQNEKQKNINQATKSDIALFVAKNLGHDVGTKKTAKRHLSAIKSFFKFCLENYYVEIDESALVNTKLLKVRGKQLPKDIPLDYVQSFLLHCRSEDEKMISEFIFNTGCRNIEASFIQTENINFDENIAKLVNVVVRKDGKTLLRFIPKSGDERLLYMTKGFSQKLKQYIEEIRPTKNVRDGFDKFLFICDKGNNFTDQRIRGFFRKVRLLVKEELQLTDEQEKKIIPHALRHTLGAELGRKEVGIKQIKDQLGHQSVESTLIYTGNKPTKITKAVEESHPME